MSINKYTMAEDTGCKQGLLALGRRPNVDTMSCGECLFPFCIRGEARNIKILLKNAALMQANILSSSLKSISAQLNISVRTIQRNIDKQQKLSCYWCVLDRFSKTAYCRPRVCTVAKDGGVIAVALSRHGRATQQEFKLIQTLVEDLFPYGVLKSNGAGQHDHWVVSNIGTAEADGVYVKMQELSKYAPALR